MINSHNKGKKRNKNNEDIFTLVDTVEEEEYPDKGVDRMSGNKIISEMSIFSLIHKKS